MAKSIEIFKMALSNMGSDSIIKLLSGLVFGDITKIRDFDENETYFKDDIIYRFDEDTQQHQILKSTSDNVKGTFNVTNWNSLTNESVTISGKTALGDLLTTEKINLVDAINELFTFVNNNVATAEQGAKADNALPASQYTALDILAKLKTVDGVNSGLDSDLFAGKSSDQYATAEQGTKADNALPKSGGTLTGDLTLNADPTQGLHAATKQYVDTVAQGLKFKPAVRAATTENITLSGLQIIDTVSIISGDRVLVKNQTDEKQNGIYIANESTWTRSLDFDDTPDTEITGGEFVFVTKGSTNADIGFVVITDAPIVLGTDPIQFTEFSGSSDLLAGYGLQRNGNQLDILLDGTSLVKSANGLKVNTIIKTATITTDWVGESAPYTQSVSVTGLTPEDIPTISPIYSDTYTTALLEQTAWGKISKIETQTDCIIVTCFQEKPTQAINIQLKL